MYSSVSNGNRVCVIIARSRPGFRDGKRRHTGQWWESCIRCIVLQRHVECTACMVKTQGRKTTTLMSWFIGRAQIGQPKDEPLTVVEAIDDSMGNLTYLLGFLLLKRTSDQIVKDQNRWHVGWNRKIGLALWSFHVFMVLLQNTCWINTTREKRRKMRTMSIERWAI